MNICTWNFACFIWYALSKQPYHDCWLVLPKKLPLAKALIQWRASLFIKFFSLVSKLNTWIRVILNWVKGQLNLRNWSNWASAASGPFWVFLWSRIGQVLSLALGPCLEPVNSVDIRGREDTWILAFCKLHDYSKGSNCIVRTAGGGRNVKRLWRPFLALELSYWLFEPKI